MTQLKKSRLFIFFLVSCLIFSLTGCASANTPKQASESTETAVTESASDTSSTVALSTASEAESVTDDTNENDTPEHSEKNGDIMILYTSDVHCGVSQGFGYVGLYEVRKSLEAQGYTTILVDDGDSIQGEAMGTLTKGEANIKLMNAVGYDVCIPGNHEFDYGADQFLNLSDQAEFTYISCNLNKDGEPVLPAYKIIEAAGKKIGFVGITTPESLTTSNPVHFQDENGKTVYGFLQDDDGTGVYNAVQKAVDDARAEGAEYIYVLAHVGMEETVHPWTYADIISHTTGIDVFLDGHSHDTEQVVMKNAEGKDVIRSAVGTKMHCIGHSLITEDGIGETDIWSWPNDIDAPSLLGLENEMTSKIEEVRAELDEILSKEVANIDFEITINDPVEKDTSGNPIRMIRRAETNMGDLCADAARVAADADIGIINGGGVRAGLPKGQITYEDIIGVYPYNNAVCLIEVTGQQILDALEWGARGVPEENGSFLHVSGITYEIDSTIDTPCTSNSDGMMTGISGKRRVSNVLYDGKPIDPDAKFRVAGSDFVLLQNGDGTTAFDGATVIDEEATIDNQALISYITNTLEGKLDAYSDPYGQGRIVIKE